jgi:hypothetical protein
LQHRNGTDNALERDKGGKGEDDSLSLKDLMDLASRLYHQYFCPVLKHQLKPKLVHKIEQELLCTHPTSCNPLQTAGTLLSPCSFTKGSKTGSRKSPAEAIALILKYFTKSQRQLLKAMRQESMPFFLRSFVEATLSIETLEKRCPLPKVSCVIFFISLF